MFACIYGRTVSKSYSSTATDTENTASALIDLAFTFSPLVEQTTVDTVVLDISGQDLLFGSSRRPEAFADEAASARNVANEIVRRGKELDLEISVGVAATPDVAIHAARAFKQITFVSQGEELSKIGSLSIKNIDYSLGAIDPKRAEEIHETLRLWGIHTFGDLARLPAAGVAERLGQDGVRLQKLAQGKSDRQLILIRPPVGFKQTLELEHPITELEPLSFILSRLLNQLCANLCEYALATNEIRLQFVTEPRLVEVANGGNGSPENQDARIHERTITLPIPMRNPKTLLRLLLFDIEAQPPLAPIIAVTLTAEPVQPRASQTGLFIPLAPEPEKLEITLARLGKLVGADNVGSPELLDTHRPDAFRMKRFSLSPTSKRKSNPQSGIRNSQCVVGFRILRPPWPAEVRTLRSQPTRINARSAQASGRIRGSIVCAAGPWRASGDWWRSDVWARDEWDVAVVDPVSQKTEMVCRIYRDLVSEEWFVEGIYD